MVHDWFVHKKGVWSHTHDIPLDAGDTWHERPMRVPKTPADPPKVAGSTRPPAYINENTHWWDGSQIYGSSASTQASLRAGREGKVLVSPSGRLGVDPVTGREITGFTENGWVGLSLLHALFALEHNAICDELKKHNPLWDDERLFQQARLVNAALLAKIHTVEWSTSILPNQVASTGLRANWFGLLGEAAEHLPRARGQRHPARHPRFADRPSRHAVLAHRGVRVGLPHAHADAGRLHVLLGGHRRRARAVRAARAVRTPRRRRCWRASTRPICSTRSASPIRARCGCTTTRSRCRTWCRTTASASTSAPSTSCAIVSAACPATTSSAGCCTSRRSRSFDEISDVPAVVRGDPARLRQRSREGGHDGRPDGGAAARRASASATRPSGFSC